METQYAIEVLKSGVKYRYVSADYEKARDIAISALEKKIPRNPILCMNEESGMFVEYADGNGEYKTKKNNWWRCPCCNEVVGQRVIAHKHIHDQRKKKYCEKCGQAIDWSDAD